MLNKNPNLDVSNTITAKQYEERFNTLSDKDQKLIYEFIKEVNLCGYQIQYTFQLAAFDKSDQCLLPIIIKYYTKIDDPNLKCTLIRCIGRSGQRDMTSFLLDEFRKPNTDAPFNLSRRGCASSALYSMKDKRYFHEYIELIKNPDTRNDSMLIGTMLGKMKSEEALPVLIEALDDPNSSLQYMAIQALGNFKGKTELIQYLEPFLLSSDKTLRSYAKNAINKIKGKRGNPEMER